MWGGEKTGGGHPGMWWQLNRKRLGSGQEGGEDDICIVEKTTAHLKKIGYFARRFSRPYAIVVDSPPGSTTTASTSMSWLAGCQSKIANFLKMLRMFFSTMHMPPSPSSWPFPNRFRFNCSSFVGMPSKCVFWSRVWEEEMIKLTMWFILDGIYVGTIFAVFPVFNANSLHSAFL